VTDEVAKALHKAYMQGATNASSTLVLGENTWARTIGAKADLFTDEELFDRYLKLFEPIGGFKGCTDTVTEDIQAKVAQFFADPDATIQDLSNALQSTFAPWRADMIAISETTRMKSAQTELYQDALGSDSWTFQTEEDDLVCEECGPMDGEIFGPNDDKPPIHVNCRCEAVVSTSYTALGQAFMDQWGIEINIDEGDDLADAEAA
jgi:SPP1 gp7 family putative phage head morphogenesis protein